MQASIKVISVISKVARNGAPYQEIWAEIHVSGQVFIRKFVVFLARIDDEVQSK